MNKSLQEGAQVPGARSLLRSPLAVLLSHPFHTRCAAHSTLLAVRIAAYLRIASLLNTALLQRGAASVQKGLEPCATSILDVSLATLRSYSTLQPAHPKRTEQEAAAALTVLQAALLLLPTFLQGTASQSDLTALLLQCMESEAASGHTTLPCSCLDTLLALQCSQPEAFVSFTKQHSGIQRVAAVIRSSAAQDKVRAHAARFLNLLLTHAVPEYMSNMEESGAQESNTGSSCDANAAGDGQGPSLIRQRPGSSQGSATSTAGTSNSASSSMHHKKTTPSPIDRAVLVDAVETAKAEVEAALGREAAAMIGRKVPLYNQTRGEEAGQEGKDAAEAEAHLERLASALSLFVLTD